MRRKYESPASGYHFVPFSVETSGVIGPAAIALVNEVGRPIADQEDDSLFPFPENHPCHRLRKQFQYLLIWQERRILMNWCMNGCPRNLLFMLFAEKLYLKFYNYMCFNGYVKMYVYVVIFEIVLSLYGPYFLE